MKDNQTTLKVVPLGVENELVLADRARYLADEFDKCVSKLKEQGKLVSIYYNDESSTLVIKIFKEI